MLLAMRYPVGGGVLRISERFRSLLTSRGAVSRVVLSLGGIALGIILLVQLFGRINFKDAPAELANVGVLGFALALIPYCLIALVDTTGWRRLLAEPIPLRKIFNIRAATEALVICAPMGSLLSDPAKAWMLKRRYNMRLSQTTASIVLRKFLLGFGQGLVALVVAAVAWIFGDQLGVHDLPSNLLTALISIGGGMAVLGLLLTSFVCFGALLRQAHTLVLRIRIVAFQRWMLKQEVRFEELHQSFAHLGKEGFRDVLIAALEYVSLWILELFETYIILRVLGVDISFTQASVIEAICTLARAAAFMVPGGIGVQDSGYASLLIASGVHGPSVAAFLLLKRLREALWAALGLGLLFAERRPPLTAPLEEHEVSA